LKHRRPPLDLRVAGSLQHKVAIKARFPETWTAARSQWHVSQQKTLGRSILLEQPFPASATWSKISSTWTFHLIPCCFCRLQPHDERCCTWRRFLVLGNHQLCVSTSGARCFSVEAPIRRLHYQEKGARELEHPPDKHPRRHVESLRGDLQPCCPFPSEDMGVSV